MEDQKETRGRVRPARRYRYAENYQLNRTKQADGTMKEEMEYIGPLLQAEHSAENYRHVRLFARTVSVSTILSGLLLLMIPGFAVYQGGLYVFVPVVMALIPQLYHLLGSLKMPEEDATLQEDTHRFAHKRVFRAGAGVAVLYSLTLILTAVFLIRTGTKPGALDLLYFVLAGLPVILNVILLRKMKQLRYHPAQ